MHLNNIFYYTYFYKYKQERLNVKELIKSDNFSGAISKLNSLITEHDDFINSNSIQNDGTSFTSIDNLTMKHARRHLDHATFEANQKQATINILDE